MTKSQYQELVNLDNQFQAALEREYGNKASEMRYIPNWKYPSELKKIADNFCNKCLEYDYENRN